VCARCWITEEVPLCLTKEIKLKFSHTEALALARQLGRTNLEAFQLGDLGNVARRQGDLVRATALHTQALELKHALSARRQIAISLQDLACVAGAEGRGERAVCILGTATAIREEIGTPQPIPERNATEQAVAGARGARRGSLGSNVQGRAGAFRGSGDHLRVGMTCT
jgi:hypothetical protein